LEKYIEQYAVVSSTTPAYWRKSINNAGMARRRQALVPSRPITSSDKGTRGALDSDKYFSVQARELIGAWMAEPARRGPALGYQCRGLGHQENSRQEEENAAGKSLPGRSIARREGTSGQRKIKACSSQQHTAASNALVAKRLPTPQAPAEAPARLNPSRISPRRSISTLRRAHTIALPRFRWRRSRPRRPGPAAHHLKHRLVIAVIGQTRIEYAVAWLSSAAFRATSAGPPRWAIAFVYCAAGDFPLDRIDYITIHAGQQKDRPLRFLHGGGSLAREIEDK
jgi:hypothetical protein